MAMLGDAIGMMRAEAIWRVLVALIWLPIYVAILAIVWVPVAVIIGIIDVLIQFIFDSEGIDYDRLLMSPYGSLVQTVEWLITGTGEANLIPYV
jgi:hypothetical protein